MKLSVVIPSRGNWSRLKLTLDALVKQSLPAHVGWEVLIVLDGVSLKGELNFQHSLPALRYLPLPRRGGRGAARNAGIAAARGEIIVLLDDDVVVNPGFLTAHLAQQVQSPSLCHGPMSELPALVWIDDVSWAETTTDGNGLPRRIREWAARVLRDLSDPIICREKHGRPSRLERDGMEAFRQGRSALAWVAFAGANLSAPRKWLLDDGFDERPGTRWGLEDLSLALRWHLWGLPLTVAADAWGLHLSHPRPAWRESQRANLCCLDFLPEDVALSILAYLEGKIMPDELESVLLALNTSQVAGTT